jgi:hypothetical protein
MNLSFELIIVSALGADRVCQLLPHFLLHIQFLSKFRILNKNLSRDSHIMLRPLLSINLIAFIIQSRF